ncbi:hypothetical protein [Carboxylicivirga sp. M1479]|uniref:hypothetical protein n=1 Tax=Carboxylicivirga sp. M1479 TaxID=2594476 RepID=UPI0011780931|nr:hypothetical protein [Carboxylicivirga sp. M1479]TRX70809.1 hypothetical protein FNN09_09985 [Carboxylicivirga sp. M1479]
MKLFKQIIFPVLIGGALFMSACETNSNYINPKELIEAEQELLDRYYHEGMHSGMTRIDSMTAASIDTVDHRFESGLMMFHTKIGEGDSIKVFKRVGYRFTAFNIAQDEETDVTYEAYAGTNESSYSPASYTTFPVNDAGSASGTGVPLGLNEALLHMRFGGEAKIVLPSEIGGVNGYYTTIYELRVTYLEH